MDIEVKSILLPPSLADGLRVFVERRWPRNVAESTAKVDLFLPEIALSTGLAQWMASHPQHTLALRKRYFELLRGPEAEAALEKLYAAALRRKRVTLLHAGKNAENTAASILKMLMEGRRKPPSPTGPARAAAAGLRAARAKPRRR
jgi:uncharacterized protein YeaO (DUF488 family)